MRMQSIMVLIPAVAGFLWLLLYVLLTPKNDFFRKQKRLIALLSFFFLFAYLSSDTESKMMLHFVLFEQACALALAPCFISLIREYGDNRKPGLLFKLCCMVPMIHVVVGVESVYVAGFDNSVRIFIESLSFNGPMFPYLDDNADKVVYACYTYMFKTFLLIGFLLFAINLMSCVINKGCRMKNTVSYLFRGAESELAPVLYFLALILFIIVVPALVLGKECYSNLPVATIFACLILTYLITMLSITGMAGQVESQSVKGIVSFLKTKGYRK